MLVYDLSNLISEILVTTFLKRLKSTWALKSQSFFRGRRGSFYLTRKEYLLYRTYNDPFVEKRPWKWKTKFKLAADKEVYPMKHPLRRFWASTAPIFLVSYNPCLSIYSIPSRTFFVKLVSALNWHIYSILMYAATTFRDTWKFVGAIYVVCQLDSLIIDDEPINDPVEWSLVQTWIMIVFAFAWIGENLISSRFGSYTGRDKRVWFSWYKTFWLIEGWYTLSLGAAALFVITPFYNELSYNLPSIVSWWNWYTRIFFFNFVSLYAVALYIAIYMQLNLRHLFWKKALFMVAIINLILGYLLYSQFMVSFFGYLTDPNWYHKSRIVDYVQLSHEPHKWAWGDSKRDHFSFHRSTTVFWYKTDLPMASALMLFNVFFFMCLFFTYIYWVVLFRRIYTTQEVTYTFFTACVSALRQFFFYFLFLYKFIFFSYIMAYWRLPIETMWSLRLGSWGTLVLDIISEYHLFILSLL